MSTAPVKFSLSERDRRPPVELPKTEELTSPDRDLVAGEGADGYDGVIGEDNPPMRQPHVAARPRRR